MRTRWERDNRILATIGVALGAALAGLYAVVLRARELSPAGVTNRVLLFVLFYIVVVLILALAFVLARSAAKLLVDARRGLFGSRFRVRVVATHVGLALLPIALLLLPITGLLQRSVDFWFEPPLRETVRSGREVTDLLRRRSAEAERRAADALAASLPRAGDAAALSRLLASAREAAGLDYLEWRPVGGDPVAFSSPRWPVREVSAPSGDWVDEARARGAARRTEQTAGGGQAGRTVVVLPEGLLVAGSYDPPEEAVPIRSLARATSTYAMLEAERASLKAVQVLFFLLLAFLVLLAAVWVGLLLARRVTRPIAALASSARRVGAGDFDVFVEAEGDDEIGELARAFNAMTRELKTSRESLQAANAEMAATNRRLDEERRTIRTVLAHLGAGVLAFAGPVGAPAPSARLLAVNGAARALLRRDGETKDPPDLGGLLSEPWLAPLCDFLCRALSAPGPRETTLTLSPPGEKEGLVLEARVARVPGEAGGGSTWVVTLEDTTALVRAERAAAWEEAARRMAHEIKNPLTPIRLAAERMIRKARSARGETPPGADALLGAVEEGASAIVEEVRTLSGLVDAFGRFARLPAADLSATDLGAVVTQVVTLYADTKRGVAVAADLPEPLAPVRADAEQVKRALVNLVDNAVAATPPGGKVTVSASVSDGHARLAVADDGPGIRAEDRDRVFDPAFSTKPRGTGLGLAITARIAAEHAGRVWVEENRPRGCRFVLEWPTG